MVRLYLLQLGPEEAESIGVDSTRGMVVAAPSPKAALALANSEVADSDEAAWCWRHGRVRTFLIGTAHPSLNVPRVVLVDYDAG